MTDHNQLDALLNRITAITGHQYASRGQCLLNCDLGVITLGDVADLCAAIADLRGDIGIPISEPQDRIWANAIETAAEACDAVKRAIAEQGAK